MISNPIYEPKGAARMRGTRIRGYGLSALSARRSRTGGRKYKDKAEGKSVNVEIRPRQPSDRGGYICMPMKKNVPEGRPEWTLVCCPECGAECWRDPKCEVAEEYGAKALCTMCALRRGAGNAGTGYA